MDAENSGDDALGDGVCIAAENLCAPGRWKWVQTRRACNGAWPGVNSEERIAELGEIAKANIMKLGWSNMYIDGEEWE